jgi:hypothetical protein
MKPKKSPRRRTTMLDALPASRRSWAIFAGVASAHVAVLGASGWVASHAPAPKPSTEVVSVMVGHVDADTGDFRAEGLARARIRAREW